MEQIARSATQETWGYLDGCRYVLHDRDTKFCPSFRSVLAAGGVKTMALPARSPNLNAFAERWVRSAKEECLSKLILFGEGRCPGPWPSSARIITENAIIRAKATSSFSRMPQIKPNSAATPLSVAGGSEDFSSSMPAPHEFFDHTRSRARKRVLLCPLPGLVALFSSCCGRAIILLGLSPAFCYGLRGAPSLSRAPRFDPGVVGAYFAAIFSSMSIPSPGLALAYRTPFRSSGVPGNSSFS